MTQHRVELVQRLDDLLDRADLHAHGGSHRFLAGRVVRQELMQRRIEQTYGAGAAFERLENAHEVLALQRQQLFERLAVLLHGIQIGRNLLTGFLQLSQILDLVLGLELLDGLGHENEAAEADNAIAFEEHVLGAAEADAFGAELDRHGRVMRRIRIGADLQLAVLVGQGHDLTERSGQLGIDRINLAEVDRTGRPVQRNPVALLDGLTAGDELALLIVHGHITGTGYAAGSHAARHHSGVRGHATTRRQDALGHRHAADILGAGLDATENNGTPHLGPQLSLFSAEHHLPRCGARRGRQPHGDLGGLLLGGLDEYRVQELVERLRIDAQDRFFLGDQLLFDHVAGNLHGRLGGALAATGLQHVKRTVLDRELDILHIAVVLLKPHANGVELLEKSRHRFLQGGEVLLAIGLGHAL